MHSDLPMDQLLDRQDRYIAMLIVGVQFFAVGGVLGIFASQDFTNGTDFMQRIVGAEQAVGLVLMAVGFLKVRAIKAELAHQQPQAAKAAAASAH